MDLKQVWTPISTLFYDIIDSFIHQPRYFFHFILDQSFHPFMYSRHTNRCNIDAAHAKFKRIILTGTVKTGPY